MRFKSKDANTASSPTTGRCLLLYGTACTFTKNSITGERPA